MTTNKSVNRMANGGFRKKIGLTFAVVGFLLFILGAQPSIFGLDRSPITGYVQILTFLLGLAFVCVGGYMSLASLWNGYQKTIAADIGLRLVSTGYVIAFGSAMADFFGFGSQAMPVIPIFGGWQKLGVVIGQVVIAAGFILMLPFGQQHKD